MINVPKYDKKDRKKTFEQLPKGAYVCKILNLEEASSKKGQNMIKISFDIAEGEHKDFYMNQYKANTSEDKKWSYDAIIYLVIPYDGCDAFITENWATFWANVEDSNNGYVFAGDEKATVGKTFGGVFRIEQTQSDKGYIYDHTRLAYTCEAQKVRDGKTKPAKDKLVTSSSNLSNAPKTASSDGFIDLPQGAEDYPWK